MPVFGPRTDADWADASKVTLTGGAIWHGDDLILDPKDRSPNRNWREVGEDGNPRAWGFDGPPERVGSLPFATPPGNRPANSGAPPEEQAPPRRKDLTRQSDVPVPPGASWTAFEGLAVGWQPETGDRSRLPRPGAPFVEVVPSGRKGFAADTFGIRVDLRTEKRKGRTLPSGYTFVAVQAGQGFRVYVPPEALAGARFMGVYATRPGSGGLPGTEREVDVVDLRQSAAVGFWDVTGPYRDQGKRPATRDESGPFGGERPPAPLGRRRHGRAFFKKVHGDFDLQPGIYMGGYRIAIGGGLTLVSHLTDRVVVNSVEKNRALEFGFPGLPAGWRVVPVLYYQPLTQGPVSWYRAYIGKSPSGGEHTFGPVHMDPGVKLYGYPPDTEPKGLHVRLADTGAPGREDTSGIEGPDPNAGPDAAPVGIPLPDAPADYLLATADEDALGRETALSPAQKVSLATVGQTFRISPAQAANGLRNPQGSERTAAGTVYDWANLGANATSTADFVGGSLRLTGSSAGTSLAPASSPVPVGDETQDFAVKGRLRLARVTGTSPTRLQLQYADDAGANVGAPVTLLEMAATGELSLGEGSVFGPSSGATAKPDGATQAKLVATGADAAWNSDAFFEDLAIFPFPKGLRRFESPGPGAPANFKPSPGVPYPASSASALGPVPQAEAAAPAAEPLVEAVTFEGGAWPAAWAALGSNNLADVVETTGAIFGAYSRRIQDDSTNNVKQHLRRRVYTDADLGGSPNLHVRVYDSNPRLPTKGEALVDRINDANGNTMGSVYYTPSSARLYRHKANGDRDAAITVLSGLSSGVAVDFELGVTNGNTKNGAVTFAAGTGGNPRTPIAKHTGRDFTNRVPRQVDDGVRETDAGQRITRRTDNILVSKNGAPLDYEAPAAPSGVTVPATPPPPDAPPLSGGGYRLFDFLNSSLNQWWWFIEPGVAKAEGQDHGGYCKALISVMPGETVSQFVQGSWRLFEGLDSPASTEGATHQFFVTLKGPGKEPLEIGSPFGPGRDASLATRVGGTRSNTATGMAASVAWGAEDFWHTFVVPPGYIWATIGPRNGLGGVYAWQEHFIGKGNLNTQTLRDAARDYGRATTGHADIVVDTRHRSPYNWPLSDGRLSMGVAQGQVSPGASISNVLYRGGPTETGPWSPAVSDPALVPESPCYLVSFDMNGQTGEDGAFPIIAGGSAFVVVRPFVSVLLKPDRSVIPGGVVVDGVDSPDSRPRSEVLEMDGDIVAPRRSKDVSYMTRDLTFRVGTEEAKRYLESLRAGDELAIESPALGGDGRALLVRLANDPKVDTSLPTSFVAGSSARRNVYGVGTLTAPQSLQESPLVSP